MHHDIVTDGEGEVVGLEIVRPRIRRGEAVGRVRVRGRSLTERPRATGDGRARGRALSNPARHARILEGVAADTRRAVAGSSDVTGIFGRAWDGIAALARPGLAGIRLGARVAIVAGCPVGERGIRAHARGWIAHTCPVTLVAGSAGHRIAARACAGLALVGLGARVAVAASRSVGERGIRAHARGWIAHACRMALIARRAGDGVSARAHAGLAEVDLGARVPVIASRSVGNRGIRTHARGWIAHASRVALVARRAGHRIAARAPAGLALVGLGARVAIVARRSVGERGIRAQTRGWIAHAGRVALVARRARHGIPSRAEAGLAGIAPGAGVPVIATCPVGDGGVLAANHGVAGIGRARVVVVARDTTTSAIGWGVEALLAPVGRVLVAIGESLHAINRHEQTRRLGGLA